jgi:predicted PurR-regulated permease PerM
MTQPATDLTRTTIAVLTILALMASSLYIVQPLFGAFIWAVMIVVATWPWLKSLERLLWGRRGLAVTVMTLGLFLLFAVPIGLAVGAVVSRVGQMESGGLSQIQVPPPPDWVQRVPAVGSKIDAAWREVASGQVDLATKVQPYFRTVLSWLGRKAGSFLGLLIQLIVIVVSAAVLYANGEIAAGGVLRFARRLAGERGDQVVRLAGQAVRGVALGVVVTAVLQTVVSGSALWIAGVPSAGFLTALIFLLCVAQIGPALVLFPAVGWLYWSGQSGRGTMLLVLAILAVTMDNVIRPILIKKGADLPLALVFIGVIGGLIAFGLIGIFVGPVVLAVTYTLLESWVQELPDPAKVTAESPPTRG